MMAKNRDKDQMVISIILNDMQSLAYINDIAEKENRTPANAARELVRRGYIATKDLAPGTFQLDVQADAPETSQDASGSIKGDNTSPKAI